MGLGCTDICQKLALFWNLGARDALQREEHLYQSPQKQYHGSKAKLKKIMAASADNKAFGSKRGLRLWLVSAAWTRAAGASGWLFKAVGSLDKLNKMSWCHVTMSSSEPASEKKKEEASACYGKETVGIFAQARGRSMSRLFEMDVTHNCPDVTVKSCRVYVCERTYGAFLVEERRQKTLHPNRSALVPSRSNTTTPIVWLHSPSSRDVFLPSLSPPPFFGEDVPLIFRMFQTAWQLWQTEI